MQNFPRTQCCRNYQITCSRCLVCRKADSVINIGVKSSCTVKNRIPSGRFSVHSHETVGKYAFEEYEYSACFSIELLIKQRGEKCQWFHCPSVEFGLWCQRKSQNSIHLTSRRNVTCRIIYVTNVENLLKVYVLSPFTC